MALMALATEITKNHNMKQDILVMVIEYVNLSGLTLTTAGHWVDHRGDVVAKTTSCLVDMVRLASATEPAQKARKVKKVRQPMSDWSVAKEGRLRRSNTKDLYNPVKARKTTKCYCCHSVIRCGDQKYAHHGYDVCAPCYHRWPKGKDIHQHPDMK